MWADLGARTPKLVVLKYCEPLKLVVLKYHKISGTKVLQKPAPQVAAHAASMQKAAPKKAVLVLLYQQSK